MESKALFDNFEIVANAPGGIVLLRELILDLAVRGRLVAQIASEGVGLDFLSEFPSTMVVPEATKSVPFEIPKTWAWSCFGNVSINRDSERIPISKPARETRQGPYDYYGASGVIDSFDEFLFDQPLLLIGEDGANLVNRSTPIAFIARGKYWVNNHAHVVDSTSEEALEYLAIVINQMDLKPFLTGTAQPKLNQAKLNRLQIPVPPFEEQKRIVAKINELMALCDQLEAAQDQSKSIRAFTRNSIIDAISTATTPEEFDVAWKRISHNWLTIVDTTESIADLRKLLFRLALRGHLTKFPTERFQKMKFGSAVKFTNGYAFKSEWYVSSGVRLVRGQNIAHGRLDWSEMRNIDNSRAREFSKFELAEGDIVLALDRPLISTGLKWAQISLADLPALLLQRTALIKPNSQIMSNEFLRCWIQSPYFIDGLDPGRSNGIPHISTKELGELDVWLPPVEQQLEIIKKVDEMMVLCDELEKTLIQRNELAKKIAGSIVSQAVA
jgi:type I restriction enzyme, S subunit